MCQIKPSAEFNTIPEIAIYFQDEKICIKHIKEWRWKDGVRCIYCGFDKIYEFKNGKRFKCASCKEYFTITCGTIMQSTKLHLSKWIMAMFLLGSNKKGISSVQLGKYIGVTQRTAWVMSHKIRESLQQEDTLLDGVVSSDESFIGGKNKNRHKDKRMAYKKGRDFKDKTPVIGMMQQDGYVRTKVLPDVGLKSIRNAVITTVKKGATLVTDEWNAYKGMNKYYRHEVVDHGRGNYITPSGYSSNNLEGFWAHLKRMIIGVYHKVSRKHLQRYLNELTFRHNTRNAKQGDRLSLMMQKIEIRLTYKKLVYG